MTRSATTTPDLKPERHRATRHSVERLVRDGLHVRERRHLATPEPSATKAQAAIPALTQIDVNS